jgi:hypothetical protein
VDLEFLLGAAGGLGGHHAAQMPPSDVDRVSSYLEGLAIAGQQGQGSGLEQGPQQARSRLLPPAHPACFAAWAAARLPRRQAD